MDREKRTSLVLMGTVKNSAFSTAVALSLMGKTASVPAGILVTVLIILFLVAAPHWLRPHPNSERAPEDGAGE
jgi:ACR3 family arsenite efflux pump ArsB